MQIRKSLTRQLLDRLISPQVTAPATLILVLCGFAVNLFRALHSPVAVVPPQQAVQHNGVDYWMAALPEMDGYVDLETAFRLPQAQGIPDLQTFRGMVEEGLVEGEPGKPIREIGGRFTTYRLPRGFRMRKPGTAVAAPE